MREYAFTAFGPNDDDWNLDADGDFAGAGVCTTFEPKRRA
jgi:hypothetical protein